MSSKKKTQKKETVAPVEAPAAPVEQEVRAKPVPPVRPKSKTVALTGGQWTGAGVMMVALFLCSCVRSVSSLKWCGMILLLLAIPTCFVKLSTLRRRLSIPMIAVAAWVLMNGLSNLYAVSGSFALREFLKVVTGFCVFLLILAWSKAEDGGGRLAAISLEGFTAIASLISIDMISTRWISGLVIKVLYIFGSDYDAVAETALEVGTRIRSIYENPNVFSGVVGLGLLLALGSAVSCEHKGEKRFHLVCLFVNSLAFVLAFSMGASGMIALAFLVLLVLERKSRRGALLILMVETLVLALASAFPIFVTSFDAWTGVRPVPLLCAVGGAVLLCAADQLEGGKIASFLQARGKVLALTVAAVLVLLAGFGALAVNVTGPKTMEAGETLHRSDYPAPGSYTLETEATGSVWVNIESQNTQQAMMHTSTVLYSGEASGAAFTVPEDSKVVHFNFAAGEPVTLETARFRGEKGEGTLKLDYKLLPGFMANRLQGLFANQNAIQRTVFFADGLKLFRRSPVIGLGIGAFENGILGVQSFFYETKYAHNHYIETLANTGVIGLILFLAVLILNALALWKNLRRGEEAAPMAPALGAAMVFMAGHAAVEVVFSISSYLLIAFGVLGLISLYCGEELPLPGNVQGIRTGVVVGMAALLTLFAVLLGLNMSVASKIESRNYTDPMAAFEEAAKLDRFEWTTYMLSYVYASKDVDPAERPDIRANADKYAQRLIRVNSNSIPRYLGIYYFETGRPEKAIEALEQYVDYVSADVRAWQISFDMFEAYLGYSPEARDAVERFYGKMEAWNASNWDALVLEEETMAYIHQVLNS